MGRITRDNEKDQREHEKDQREHEKDQLGLVELFLLSNRYCK